MILVSRRLPGRPRSRKEIEADVLWTGGSPGTLGHEDGDRLLPGYHGSSHADSPLVVI